MWNIDALTYVETLFGHQDQVLAVDSLHRERAVSCGGRDRSLRLWKVGSIPCYFCMLARVRVHVCCAKGLLWETVSFYFTHEAREGQEGDRKASTA